MNSIFIALLVLALGAAWVFFWRQWQDNEEIKPDVEHDERVSPLLRGINYLLSDEPDRALQEMVQVARLRSEAADVYMALGEMFRSHGEIGRAVRIHQNILARPDVPSSLYLQAHLALAKDFQAGGLLDRALRHYQKVLDVKSDHIDALTASLRIREQSSEWGEAEELLSRIERLQGDEDSLHRAYLWSALASDAMDSGDMDVAERYIEKSLALAEACGQAHILKIKMALEKSDLEEIKSAIECMQKDAPRYLHLLVPLLIQKDGKAYEDLLMQCWKSDRDDELALAWLEEVASIDKDAISDLQQRLEFVSHNLRNSLRLAALGMNGDSVLVAHAKQWRVSMKHYCCTECGVQIVDMRWQCPQCHHWGSMEALTESNR